jgi:diguanylate cyclase (GGDEF)-like protein
MEFPMPTQSTNSRFLATHDERTGLPNRAFIEELTRALGLDAGTDLVVIAINLRESNGAADDRAGVVEDHVLNTIAQRLRLCARGDDVVARVGADKFVLLLTPRIAPEEEARLLERLRRAIAEPILTGADWLGLSAKVGVAYCPEDGVTLDQLLAQADRRVLAGSASGAVT